MEAARPRPTESGRSLCKMLPGGVGGRGLGAAVKRDGGVGGPCQRAGERWESVRDRATSRVRASPSRSSRADNMLLGEPYHPCTRLDESTDFTERGIGGQRRSPDRGSRRKQGSPPGHSDMQTSRLQVFARGPRGCGGLQHEMRRSWLGACSLLCVGGVLPFPGRNDRSMHYRENIS